MNERRPGKANELAWTDRAVHDWYRFVLSYPPHLVRQYLADFTVTAADVVLDPFCGTGTTLVECKKLGIPSIGLEANKMTYFASKVKLDWAVAPETLIEQAEAAAQAVRAHLEADGINDDAQLYPLDTHGRLRTLPDSAWGIMLKDSISPLPLHKTLVLLDYIESHFDQQTLPFAQLALAKALVTSIGNLKYSPEVGIGKIRLDVPVVTPWVTILREMAADIRSVAPLRNVPAIVYQADSRRFASLMRPESVSAVITSPPYPNEKDYTRMTRMESVLLGFIDSREELRALKKHLMRSNTRNVYVGDDDDLWVANVATVQELAEAIENRRIELGKTSGFERLYSKTTRLYFGGMARHLADLRTVLRPNAMLAYVVGDQASYLRVMIRTGQILAEIAEDLGYELVRIDLFRTRMATATKDQLREEVVVLKWKG